MASNNELQILAEKCWHQTLANIEGTWAPSSQLINEMEGELHQLNRPIARLGCSDEEGPLNVNDFERQYVGVRLHGRDVIFINASEVDWDSGGFVDNTAPLCSVVTDGYCSYWSAVYDPFSRAFSEFEVAPIS